MAVTKEEGMHVKNKMLKINKSVQIVSGKSLIKETTKTKAGMRTVGIPDEVIELMIPGKDDELMFKGPQTNTLLNNRQIKRFWDSFKRALDIKLGAKTYRNKVVESKIEGLHIHCLRHTCITRLLLDGADIKEVQLFAGHEDVTTTYNIYAHITSEQAAQSLLKIQNKSK